MNCLSSLTRLVFLILGGFYLWSCFSTVPQIVEGEEVKFVKVEKDQVSEITASKNVLNETSKEKNKKSPTQTNSEPQTKVSSSTSKKSKFNPKSSTPKSSSQVTKKSSRRSDQELSSVLEKKHQNLFNDDSLSGSDDESPLVKKTTPNYKISLIDEKKLVRQIIVRRKGGYLIKRKEKDVSSKNNVIKHKNESWQALYDNQEKDKKKMISMKNTNVVRIPKDPLLPDSFINEGDRFELDGFFVDLGFTYNFLLNNAYENTLSVNGAFSLLFTKVHKLGIETRWTPFSTANVNLFVPEVGYNFQIGFLYNFRLAIDYFIFDIGVGTGLSYFVFQDAFVLPSYSQYSFYLTPEFMFEFQLFRFFSIGIPLSASFFFSSSAESVDINWLSIGLKFVWRILLED